MVVRHIVKCYKILVVCTNGNLKLICYTENDLVCAVFAAFTLVI